MTKFITYYNLCPIPEPKDFLGISPDKEQGNIITTLGKNIIIIIKVLTDMCIHLYCQQNIKQFFFISLRFLHKNK